MLVFEFGPELASMDADAFVADVLAGRIGAAGVVTGDDFSFGKGRSGDAALLERLGAGHGVIAEAVAQVLVDGERVSSGRIRECLVAGEIGEATHLLTRAYAIEGVVERGDGRGRELGFPTANLRLGDYQRPKYGIYAARITLDDARERPGVASLGIRPTFQPPQELLEAYVFDLDEDLYGRRITVALHAFIREERKFDQLDGLVAAMREDEARARQLLAL
jgi:riboflavin kinase/FMN adenylyltransferase